MKKFIKILLAIVGLLVLLVVALVASIPLWLGPVVKPIANSTVPKITKTEFSLGHLSLNPYTGRFELGDLYLANPPNYSEKYAAKIGFFVFDVESASLATDVIHIEEVSASDVFVSIVYDKKVLNFDQIRINATNSLALASSADAEEGGRGVSPRQDVDPNPVAAERSVPDENVAAVDEKLEEVNKKKVIIDKLSISGLKVSFGIITIPVPTLTLTDIGKSSGGVSWEQVAAEISAAVMKASGAVGDAFNKMGTQALEIGTGALDTGAKGLNSALESAKKLDFKGAEKTLKETRDALKGSGDSIKKLGDSLKGLF